MSARQSNKTNIACRYFIHNMCNKTSEECEFSHDHKSPQDMVCKFYAAGHCNYGNKCRYDHIKISGEKVDKPKHVFSESIIPSGSTKLNKDAKLFKDKEVDNKSWVNANEFIPGQKWQTSKPEPLSYSEVIGGGQSTSNDSGFINEPLYELSDADLKSNMCPYAIKSGTCPFEEGTCVYEHGDNCEFCLSACLSRTDPIQRQSHIDSCIKQHEEEMERAFQIEENMKAECGICYESVYDKELEKDRRFGILSACKHSFCLNCIRTWRKSSIQSKRTCPKCREQSDFVVPSVNVINSDAEKELLIAEYKQKLKQQSCKYFQEGRGDCPFNEHCFYKHALADGTLVAPRQRRLRRGHTDYDFELPPTSYELGLSMSALLAFQHEQLASRAENLFRESMDIMEHIFD